MTNGEKIKEVFPNGIYPSSGTWRSMEYKEPTMEHVPKIDKSAMMHEIYMQGVNMAGEYQGCWVRFKEIEKIVDRYVR